jgi:hypothetical protein
MVDFSPAPSGLSFSPPEALAEKRRLIGVDAFLRSQGLFGLCLLTSPVNSLQFLQPWLHQPSPKS